MRDLFYLFPFCAATRKGSIGALPPSKSPGPPFSFLVAVLAARVRPFCDDLPFPPCLPCFARARPYGIVPPI